MSPNNRRQAQIVAQYLQTHHQQRSNVTVYYAEGDLYSENLARDLREELPSARLNSNDLTDRDQRIPCGRDDLLFFAGRADRLGGFLKVVTDRCAGHNEEPPLLMAGDDINKFMLDRDLPNGVTLKYTSFYGVTEQQASLRGRALLANDAVEVVQLAVRNVTGGEISPGGADPVPLSGLSVWHGIAEINGPGHLRGSTGFIDYGGETGQVPVNKTISILELDRPKAEPSVVWACGTAEDPGCGEPD